MYKHLLVPLDGSRLAEAALPAAAYLARTLNAQVTLVHVIERDAPQTVHGQQHLSGPDEARAYLDGVAARAFPPNTHVERHVHTSAVNDVARSLVEHTDELAPDLIVMCTHGQGGLRSLLFGSIAQQVIAMGTTPVLLVQPDKAAGAPIDAWRRLLVPLDGNPDHEQGLPTAADLAQALGAALHLLAVVPTLGTLSGDRLASGRLLPGTTTALLDLSCLDAGEYLRGQMEHWQQAGLAVTAEIRRGDPAKVIGRTVDRVQADLVVLGTHGKTGLDALWAVSVTPKVASRSRVPLLLVPVIGSD